jgi:uncharacterized protein with HEPN domain
LPPSLPEHLYHIFDEASYLLAASHKLTADEFLQNETLKRAFARSIEIIGEAAKKVPEEFRRQYPEI